MSTNTAIIDWCGDHPYLATVIVLSLIRLPCSLIKSFSYVMKGHPVKNINIFNDNRDNKDNYQNLFHNNLFHNPEGRDSQMIRPL